MLCYGHNDISSNLVRVKKAIYSHTKTLGAFIGFNLKNILS